MGMMYLKAAFSESDSGKSNSRTSGWAESLGPGQGGRSWSGADAGVYDQSMSGENGRSESVSLSGLPLVNDGSTWETIG